MKLVLYRHERPWVTTVSKYGTWILKYDSLESMEVHGEQCSPPRFWPCIFGQGQTSKAKAKAKD